MQNVKLKDIDFDLVWDMLSRNHTVYTPIQFAHVGRKVMVKTTTAMKPCEDADAPIIETLTDDYAVWDVIPYDRPALMVGIRTPNSPVTSALLEFCLGPPTIQREDAVELEPLSVPPTVVVGIRYILHHLRIRYCIGMDYTVTPSPEHEPFQQLCVRYRRAWSRYQDDIPEDVKRAIINA